MRSIGVGFILLFVLASPGHAATCPTKPSAIPSQSSEGSQPATVGQDGVGATDTSGGHGGLTAGLENEKKSQETEPIHSEEAKGLDLKKETPPAC